MDCLALVVKSGDYPSLNKNATISSTSVKIGLKDVLYRHSWVARKQSCMYIWPRNNTLLPEQKKRQTCILYTGRLFFLYFVWQLEKSFGMTHFGQNLFHWGDVSYRSIDQWPVSYICVRHYAGRKILDVLVAQPKTCHHLSQAALWAYCGTGGGVPPGHTQILCPRNLWHISSVTL